MIGISREKKIHEKESVVFFNTEQSILLYLLHKSTTGDLYKKRTTTYKNLLRKSTKS
jgi:hypothetical protein